MVGHLKSLRTMRGYKYGLYVPKFPYDEYALDALAHFDKWMFNDVLDYTKRGASVYEAQRIATEVCSQKRDTPFPFSGPAAFFWSMVKANTVHAFSVDGKKVQPYSLSQAIDGMTVDTSAGYGYPGKKKEDVLDEILAEAKQRELDTRIGRKVDPLPCMLGTRGHLRLVQDPKRRIIYNVPASQVLIEREFATPILEKLKAHPEDSPMFFGKQLLVRLRREVESDFGYGYRSVNTDISHFDRDVPVWLLHEAFDVVYELLDFETWEGKRVQPAEQRRWCRVFSMVEEYFIHTPIMLPDGSFITMHGGVPSGSAFTQLIDSIVNYMILRFVALMHGHGVYRIRVLGDDGKLDISGKPDLELWAENMLLWFGMRLSVKKTKVYGRRWRQKKFLGYDLRDGSLKRDELELFCLFVHTEKPVETVEKSFTRLIAYMFLGGVNCAKFCRFFEFFQSCYEIRDEMPVLDYELDTKRKYAGFEMPIKTLRSYTMHDFAQGLFGYIYY